MKLVYKELGMVDLILYSDVWGNKQQSQVASLLDMPNLNAEEEKVAFVSFILIITNFSRFTHLLKSI